MPLRLVNVIPELLSGETRQDSECSVTVNPANPEQIALAAFTVDPASSGNAPIFVSTDGGATWTLNVCVPGGNRTNDISVRFGGTTGVLYAAILRHDNGHFSVLRSPTFPPIGPMTVLLERDGPDQPWTETGWYGQPDGSTVDRVFITAKEGSAVVQFSIDAATGEPPAGFVEAVKVEARPGSTSPSVRTAIHRSGVIYGLFVGARPEGSDIVVVRDDDWGAGGWNDLLDTDGLSGKRVVTGAAVPRAGMATLGSVRVSSRLAIAVDPRDWRRVYVTWCDGAATPESPFRVHLRRSDDGGASWTGDLRTLDDVTNPGLAVNLRGTVALLYQRLTRPSEGNRWETHLELSDDGFVTVRRDMTVADVPDLGGTFQPIIGDYANLIALGKEFHGAFCGYNQPDLAHFPCGVRYLRKTDWAGGRLLHPDGISPVGASVDPFYFRYADVEPHDDVFVRDWAGDNGVEPSTHPIFWATGEVWNRRTSRADASTDEEPAHEPAGNGGAENWACARIRRRGAESEPTTVSARFLRAPVGVGSNFLDVSADHAAGGLDAGDLGPVVVHTAWRLDATESAHQCLAVELSTPADPIDGPSLRGRAPGWPRRDGEIVNDNNRAQRNLAVTTTPSRGAGTTEAAVFGIVHNAATHRRDVVLNYALASGAERIDTVWLQAMGGRRRRAGREGRIALAAMAPGENRWIGATFRPPSGPAGDTPVVHLAEAERRGVVNGFTIAVRLAPSREALAAGIERHRAVFTRIRHGPEIAAAAEEVDAAVAAQRDGITAARWISGLARRWPGIVALLVEAAANADVRSIEAAARKAEGALARRRLAEVLVATGALLERVDVSLTMRTLEAGDRADIAQTVRLQAELFERFRDAAPAQRLAGLSARFVDDYGARRADEDDYAELMENILPLLADLPAHGDPVRRDALLGAAQRALGERDLAALQHAHLAFLLDVSEDRPGEPDRAP